MDMFLFFFVWTIFNTVFGVGGIIISLMSGMMLSIPAVMFIFLFNCLMFFICYYKYGTKLMDKAQNFMTPTQ